MSGLARWYQAKEPLRDQRDLPRVVTISCALAFAFCLGVCPAWSQERGSMSVDQEDGGTPTEAVWQVASFASTIPYGAAKVGVAAVGGVIGGLGYALSGGDLDSAKKIWSYFMRGTYVLTPAHLKGDEPIHFVGPTPPPEPSPVAHSH